ncbi:MAG: hypothetical protein AAGA17_15990 [Actinomycetota bacterium]
MAKFPTAPKWSNQQRLVVFGAGALIVAIFGIAGYVANTDGSGGARHPAVEGITPEQGDQAVRQTRIEIDLEEGWTAEFEINRERIPLDQLESFNPTLQRVDDPLFRVIYDPGPGKVFDIFPQGQVCVTAFLTKLDDTGERGIESWCFTAT